MSYMERNEAKDRQTDLEELLGSADCGSCAWSLGEYMYARNEESVIRTRKPCKRKCNRSTHESA